MKKLIFILTPIVVVWFLLLGGGAWYFLRDRTAPLDQPPADGVTFVLEVDPFSLVGRTNGVAELKQAYVRRFAKLGLRFYWEELTTGRIRVVTPRLMAEQLAMVTNCLLNRGQLEFRLVHPESERLVKEGRTVPGYFSVLAKASPFVDRPETLLVTAQVELGLQPDPVQSAMVFHGQQGEPQISFQLTPRATAAFAQLTSEHVGQRLAILVDGRLMSAPVIGSPITGGLGVISGSWSPAEAADLAGRLESPLPAQLRLVPDLAP